MDGGHADAAAAEKLRKSRSMTDIDKALKTLGDKVKEATKEEME
jgi:hypothetical protein